MEPIAARRSIASENEMSPVERQRWSDDVAHKLSTLPDPQAAALRLVYAQGLLQSEAADRMGLTPRELSAVVADGLRQLGHLLGCQALAAQIVGCQPPEHSREPDRLRKAV